MKDFINSIIEKPFRMKGQYEKDKTLFRIRNSGTVVWIQEFNRSAYGNWDYHCELIVMDTYAVAHSKFLDQFLEKKLTQEDFILQ